MLKKNCRDHNGNGTGGQLLVCRHMCGRLGGPSRGVGSGGSNWEQLVINRPHMRKGSL